MDNVKNSRIKYEVIPVKVGECINEGPRVFFLGDCDERINLFNLFWVVRGGDEIILVDTGFEQDFARNYMPGIKQREEEDPLIQLKKLSIEPEDVTKVILTHAHFDHLSPTVFQFVNAEIFIQEVELKSVLEPVHLWFQEFADMDTVTKLKNHKKLIEVLGDEEICEGVNTLFTGGHTPGHQSIVVNTIDGPMVIAGDISFTYRNIEEDIPVGFNSNLIECFLAMEKIRSLQIPVLPGHDREVFERL